MFVPRAPSSCMHEPRPNNIYIYKGEFGVSRPQNPKEKDNESYLQGYYHHKVFHSNSLFLPNAAPAVPGYIVRCVLVVNPVPQQISRKITSFHRNFPGLRRGTSRTHETGENWEIYVRGVWSFRHRAPGRKVIHRLSTVYTQ